MKYENESKYKDCKCETNDLLSLHIEYYGRYADSVCLSSVIFLHCHCLMTARMHGTVYTPEKKSNRISDNTIEMFPNVSIIINIDFLGAQQRLV